MSIGERIRAARKEAGLTQRAVAEKSGINEANIRKYESNRQNAKIGTLEKLAEAMGTHISAITGELPPLPHCFTCPNYHAYTNAKHGRGLCDHFMHEMPEDGYCSEHGGGNDA